MLNTLPTSCVGDPSQNDSIILGSIQSQPEPDVAFDPSQSQPNANGSSDSGGVRGDSQPDNVIENATENVKKRKKKTSKAWDELVIVTLKDETKKVECKHCHSRLALQNSGSTSRLNRHMSTCSVRLASISSDGKPKQQVLSYPGLEPEGKIGNLNYLKYDKDKVREVMEKMICVHEYPFRMVEHEFFILFAKTLNPRFDPISRVTMRSDCMKLYNSEKKKIRHLFNGIDRISLTSDLWTSNQTIGYMCLTAHFMVSEWNLHKRVINFCSMAPPHTGLVISNYLLQCLTDWGIENKISTITIDNASANDSAVRHLRDSFTLRGGLYFGGKIFHVRCCAHILNLMVHDGLYMISKVIQNVRKSVKYLKMSPSRIHKFSEIVKNLNLPSSKRLILDVPTRWNSTYAMLESSLQFKDVFPLYRERDPHYNSMPTAEVKFLEVFNEATNVFSGFEYPTSNLFLPEIWKIKEVLNEAILDECDYMKDMAYKMKEKFDKYWGQCNLLMAIASILDPRYKMQLVIFCFPKMYVSEFEAKRNLTLIQNGLQELFNGYVGMHNSHQVLSIQGNLNVGDSSSICNFVVNGRKSKTKSIAEFDDWAKNMDSATPCSKSELEIYLEEGRLVCKAEDTFDVLQWWKANTLKFRIFSKMARDILSIPVSTVASESTFSAGGRVLDQFRSSLKPETVQTLICTGDWLRAEYKILKAVTVEDDAMQEVVLE